MEIWQWMRAAGICAYVWCSVSAASLDIDADSVVSRLGWMDNRLRRRRGWVEIHRYKHAIYNGRKLYVHRGRNRFGQREDLDVRDRHHHCAVNDGAATAASS
jgi:hypothetical protein